MKQILNFINGELVEPNSGDYFDHPSIGRIVVQEDQRKFKYGHQLVDESIQFILKTSTDKKIMISAQTYLTKFYNSHGFQQVGEGYLEDGIPHIKICNTGITIQVELH